MRVLILLLAALLASVALPVRAQSYPDCEDSSKAGGLCPNRQAAYSAAISAYEAAPKNFADTIRCGPYYEPSVQSGTAGRVTYSARRSDIECSSGFTSHAVVSRDWPLNSECPAGTQWDDAIKQCAKDCSASAGQTRTSGWLSGAATSSCSDGCGYSNTGAPLESTTVTTPLGTKSYARYTQSGTGLACTTEPLEKAADQTQQCHETTGGHKVCKEGNNTCVISATTGKKYCAANDTGGKAVNAERTEGISSTAESANITDPPNINNREGENWQNGPTNTVSNPGTGTSTGVAVAGNRGTPNPNGTAVSGDGSGSGTGTGGGTGEGEGDGEGGVGGDGDALYTSTGKTIGDVYSTFKTNVSASPLISSVTGFFGGCTVGGGCPVWSYDGGEMMGALTFDAHCSGALSLLLQMGAAAVLAAAAFCAFRIAFY